MPKLYARQTALTSVGGRIDYISNPKRQENLLAVHDGADAAYWQRLAQECKLASKHIDPKQNKKSVQGRELTMQLSNSLLQRLSPEEIARTLAESFEQKYNRPCVVAVHFNKKKTNLHAHLIYAERELLKDPKEKIAPRALFFDEKGIRQYKKIAILDEDGKLRPGCKIVKKGEVYERRLFGPVDQSFSSKAWLKEAKSEWLLPLQNGVLRGDVEITEYNPETGELPQQHVGKNVEYGSPEIAATIEAYNEDVKQFNQLVREGFVTKENALFVQEKEKHMRRDKGKILHRVLGRLLEMYKNYKERIPGTLSETEKENKSSLKDKILKAKERATLPSSAEPEKEQEH